MKKVSKLVAKSFGNLTYSCQIHVSHLQARNSNACAMVQLWLIEMHI